MSTVNLFSTLHKEKLNSILRLRLFFSTEKELSDLIGYQLKGNHFNRFKPFQLDAYFSKFAEECREYTQGMVDLETLLCQYEKTSKFYTRHISGTKHETNKTFIPSLLNLLYLGKTVMNEAQDSKDLALCERYDEKNKNGELNIGILVLLTYGLIPTFKNKAAQDVTDIIADFQTTYNILQEIAQANKQESVAVYKEMLCLREIRTMIEEEQNDDKYLNRLLLIHVTNDSLNRIFAMRNPELLRSLSKEVVQMDFKLPRFWRNEEETDDVVWEFMPTRANLHLLFRNVIDKENNLIHITRYEVIFKDFGCKDCCCSFIMKPIYVYNNILRRELPEDAITFDYTEIEYEQDKQTVKEITFTKESPLGTKPMTLKQVKDEDLLSYYETYIDHKDAGKDFEDIDDCPEYGVSMDEIEVSLSDKAILFNFDCEVYKLDKFDADGNETIAGVDALTHKDNFVYAELTDNGKPRSFLCLDAINQNLDIDELLKMPYFNKVDDVSNVFG